MESCIEGLPSKSLQVTFDLLCIFAVVRTTIAAQTPERKLQGLGLTMHRTRTRRVAFSLISYIVVGPPVGAVAFWLVYCAMAFADSPFAGLQDVGILLYLLVMFVMVSHSASAPVVLLVAVLVSLVPLLSNRHASTPFAGVTAFLVGSGAGILEATSMPRATEINPLVFAEVFAAVVAACVCATLLARRDSKASPAGRPPGGGV